MKCYFVYVEVEDFLIWFDTPSIVANVERNWSLSVNLLRFC